MKISLYVTVLGLLLVLFQFCSSSTPTIVIYGSNTCSHCIEFKAKLDSVGLKYSFNDVDVNEDKVLEMLEVVKKADYKGRINFPLVYLNNTRLFVAPDFEVFMSAL